MMLSARMFLPLMVTMFPVAQAARLQAMATIRGFENSRGLSYYTASSHVSNYVIDQFKKRNDVVILYCTEMQCIRLRRRLNPTGVPPVAGHADFMNTLKEMLQKHGTCSGIGYMGWKAGGMALGVAGAVGGVVFGFLTCEAVKYGARVFEQQLLPHHLKKDEMAFTYEGKQKQQKFDDELQNSNQPEITPAFITCMSKHQHLLAKNDDTQSFDALKDFCSRPAMQKLLELKLEEAKCKNILGWVDNEGDRCRDYEQMPWGCDVAQDYPNDDGGIFHGMDASEACCVCQGSSKTN